MSAAALMSVRYYQAEPSSILEDVFDEHHIFSDLRSARHRVQNMRNGGLGGFGLNLHDTFVTPNETRLG